MLLTTKFLRPTSDSRTVKRERLSSLLEPSGQRRLNLVIAPAGFGKTTLVAQWCSQVSTPSAWLSLDEHDDEPRRFWQYVIGAFEQAGLAGAADLRKQLAHQSDDTFIETITGLINTLANDGSPWSLVLDDFHFIGNPDIHRQFAYFIDYLSPEILITMVSRTEPPLPLARWRVRRWIQDIHPGLLAFSENECRQFFRNTMGLEITDEDILAICRRTEGWVAAMQLSALSGKNAANSGTELNLGERHISDYVLSEVLDQQPPDIGNFLLETACCPRLCASLCDSIRGSGNSQEMLETLLSQNLFLIPLDNRNEWFRYHDLFRDALLLRINHSESEKATRLWQLTVDWLLAHGHVQEAIAQIVRHEDWPWLARVLAEYGNNLIHSGYHLPVLNWLDALPKALLADKPQLQMLRIWGLFFANRVDTLEPLLSALEDLLDRQVADSHPDAEGALGLQSEISLMRSYLARTKRDDKSASDLTRQVLREIDHTRIPLKSVTYYGLGLDYYGKGELTEAEDALQSAVRYGQLEHKPSTVLSSGGLLAWIQYNRGDIDLALETCADIRQWVDRHYSDPGQPRLISCWQNSTLSEIHRERNHPQLAATYLQPLLEHVQRGTEPGQHVIIQYVRGHLAFSEGKFQDAIEALEDAALTARKRREQIVFEPPASTALLARCYLAAGQPQKARASLDFHIDAEFTNPLHREQNQISKARVLVALEQPERAQEILAALLNPAERNAHNRHLVEILLVYGESLAQQARKDESAQILTRALTLASEAGFMRLLAEESPYLRALLLDLPALNSPGSWNVSVRQMLLDQDKSGQPRPVSGKSPGSRAADRSEHRAGALPEPLSQRELEVLELIHEGHANKEIASRMQVAPATVKAHIRNLYSKLGVGRRTEALARARELELLNT
ncbi:LuxR C-terminal-related transcriptional regulator [Marinobacter sp. F3R08]|uniref:LuxR C-terminal-related transcriptional regulator n=1 Tax=Marinobacter sp. F3R08 TaxID=2841559 RepID=UPI001C0922F0|nr:LuxR C-terminal-related transcriptional regulator [Marinobacter sp. F3R08]MBU2955660.1 LuxR C-terminal-related transcriptional regulator [Marinobacter sp. F3R08]